MTKVTGASSFTRHLNDGGMRKGQPDYSAPLFLPFVACAFHARHFTVNLFSSFTRAACFLPHTWRRYRSRACLAGSLGAIILLLPACQSIPDAPTEVRIPYPVPCLSAADLPKPPAFVTDADLLKMTDGDLILSLAADRKQNQGYRAEMEAVMMGCVR